MKELSIEEKAKRYDEALERARQFSEKPYLEDSKGIVDYIFPELKESEDERTRKWLICYLHKQRGSLTEENHDEYNQKLLNAVTWLKKQGEQKPVITVEPKFKVGDWIIVHDKDPYQVKEINKYDYRLKHYLGGEMDYPFKYEESLRLWAIQDAKDGDVLVYDNGCVEIILLFKKWRNEVGKGAYSYAHITSSWHHINTNDWSDCGLSAHPATKEQRDLLFQKMREAGYEWNNDKKELKKISNALEECEIEQIEHGKYYYCIKDYYSGGCKRVSKGEVVQALRGMGMMALGVKANEYFIPVKCIIDNKPAWSEEDEDILFRTISDLKFLRDTISIDPKYAVNIIDIEREITWLKSLRPQNTWKPSEEMLEALYRVIPENVMEKSEDEMLLDKLYQGLKYGRVLSNK